MGETFTPEAESLSSMNHRAGLDRSPKRCCFPNRLEDYIAAENPVSASSMPSLPHSTCTRWDLSGPVVRLQGRPPYAPAVLAQALPLRLSASGAFFPAVGSGSAARNVEVIWLTGKLTPDFKTIADFRKDNLQPLKAVARQFTLLCRKLELFGGELLAVDGSKFAAVNARDQNFNALKLEELIARADARWPEYLQQLDTADARANPARQLSRTNWPPRSPRCRRGRTGTRNCWRN